METPDEERGASPGSGWSGLRVLLVGGGGSSGLEASYERALDEIGCSVLRFDIEDSVRRASRLGPAGRQLHRFVPVEAWTRKGNRELLSAARRFEPQVVLVFGVHEVTAGALGDLTKVKSAPIRVLVWPDPLIELPRHTLQALPAYDMVASYSKADVPALKQLGARRVVWVPFGADPALHAPLGSREGAHDPFACDVSFVGTWRPERARVLAALADLPDLEVKIWGNDWGRHPEDPEPVREAWQRAALYGPDFVEIARASRICLNIVDSANYPAANMRLFELLCAGGLQVATHCPEVEDRLIDGQHLFYYEDESDLIPLVRRLLAEEERRRAVAAAGRRAVLKDHTYRHRVEALLDAAMGQENARP